MSNKAVDDMPGLPLPLSGQTRLYAILGDPIDQVGSPRLFNTAFRRRDAQAVLVPLHVAPEGLPAIVAAFRAGKNFDGLVVTVPHKIAIADLVDDLGAMARRVGAVNVIRKGTDGRLLGDNFDGIGFVYGLRQRGYSLSSKRVLIVGAGGAGCAVSHAVLDERPAVLQIFDTDNNRLGGLINGLRAIASDIPVDSGPPDPDAFDVVVNCTSIGMKPSDPFPIQIDNLDASTLVVDIILKPAVTPLLEEAARRGCPTHAGIHMLEGQVEAVCDFFSIAG